MNKIIGTFLILGMSSFFVACSGEKSSEASTDETNASTEITNTVTDDATNVATEVANTEVAANLARIEFEKTVHDFGNIKEGEVVEHVFKFKNIGETPLILTGVQPSCGCTASDFTKEPVAPGGEGTISLSFNSAGKVGAQNKTATVKANIEGGQTTISFKGNVEGAANKTSGAPYK
ncbi:DUF1573 domain-containing protein [Bernardetia sp. ABR2-2B]|uniref:DUF1573 domain-containing protein n=1 Tax=Bernardetia sp. ABR2-2B TaxID=3127472 RepID=UPI0030CDB232